MSETVTLHYHRPPDRTDVFRQELLYADDEVVVTFMRATPLQHTLILNDDIALENGAAAIWFTFPGRMHDVGRFHTAAGEFTGLYANILLPVEVHSVLEWSATDLFVDVWIGHGREAVIVDQEELAEAVRERWISERTGRDALREAERLVELYSRNEWPPAIVNEWTLERVTGRVGA